MITIQVCVFNYSISLRSYRLDLQSELPSAATGVTSTVSAEQVCKDPLALCSTSTVFFF